MGTIIHKAIVCEGERNALMRARRKAKELGLPTSTVVAGLSNATWSFLIGPDGSKLGWEVQVRCETARAIWWQWVLKNKPSMEAMEVIFGEIEEPTQVIKHYDCGKLWDQLARPNGILRRQVVGYATVDKQNVEGN